MTSGNVAAIWRFPVKSMGGERLQQAEITEIGIVGDRAFALLDTDKGKVVSAKDVRHFPDVLNCKAEFVEPPRAGTQLPPLRISLPNGRSLTSDQNDIDEILSAHFGRNVVLTQSAPDDFTVDQYLPDVAGADAAGRRDIVVAQKLGAALFAHIGMQSPVPAGSFFDGFPLSILTTSTLARLAVFP